MTTASAATQNAPWNKGSRKMTFRDMILFFASCFALSSVAGLANLLRSGKELSWREISAAILWNGLAGLSVSLVCYRYFMPEHIHMLVGLSCLAGIGGISVLDFLWQFITGRVNVTVTIDQAKGNMFGNDHPANDKK